MSLDNKFKAINEKCGTVNTITPLSTTTAVLSGILMIPTIALNIILIYIIIIKVRKGKIPLFYKLLLNIAAADLMTGFIADPASINFHTKETLRIPFGVGEAYLLHLSLFFTDAVALITMTFLSFDRIAALRYPIKYHNGMKPRNENMIVGIIYPLAILLLAPYFKIKFIKQLAVFSTLNIILAIISLIATTIVFHRVGKKRNSNKNIPLDSAANNDVVENQITTSGDKTIQHQHNQKSHPINITPPTAVKTQPSLTKIQNKVTKTFLIMVGVFIVMYLPTCVTMLYMNSCGINCDCFTIHIMRDISIASILSSSVFRPLIYLLTIRQLREAMLGLFCRSATEKLTSSRNTCSVTH